MFSGVHVICFAASYAVALALELTRLAFRSGIRGAVMVGFAAAGFLAHTLYLYHEAIGASGYPLSSSRDWYLVAAWTLSATYLYLTWYHPGTAFGVLILPLVLGLIATGVYLADTRPFERAPAMTFWGILHGVSILLATVTVLLGFTTGLMYLQGAWRLKQKLPPVRGMRLPSLEWLRRANSRAVLISILMLGVGILSGVVMNAIAHNRRADAVPWSDPVILSTSIMFGWLSLSAGLGLFYRPAREGRKVAYLTVISFVFLLVALGVGLVLNTSHWQLPGALENRPGSRSPVDQPFEASRLGPQDAAGLSRQGGRP